MEALFESSKNDLIHLFPTYVDFSIQSFLLPLMNEHPDIEKLWKQRSTFGSSNNAKTDIFSDDEFRKIGKLIQEIWEKRLA